MRQVTSILCYYIAILGLSDISGTYFLSVSIKQNRGKNPALMSYNYNSMLMYCYRMKLQLNYFIVFVHMAQIWPLGLSVIALDGCEVLEVT